MEGQTKSVHAGHRERMRSRWKKEGLRGFAPHEVLEFLLYYSIPRGDDNENAHRLLDQIATLAGVLDASCEELAAVPGIGEQSAVLLHMLPELCAVYLESRSADGVALDKTESICAFLSPKFIGKTEEVVLLISLDSKRKLIACDHIYTGSVTAAQVSIRKVMETALRRAAAAVVLAHNHPGGLAIPSGEDIASTKRVAEALATVRIPLLDHFIYADGELVSMAESKLLDALV